jgi:hypothetical protein
LDTSGPGGKRAGKLQWVDRRRPATRRSGFSATASGSEYTRISVETTVLTPFSRLVVSIDVPGAPVGAILGFGGYVYLDGTAQVTLSSPAAKHVLKIFDAPDWGKFGSQWYSEGTDPTTAELVVSALSQTTVATALLGGGVIEHEYLAGARSGLMANMHLFAPEANFYRQSARVGITTEGVTRPGDPVELNLKRCNRCGRLLPINVNDELKHLSFTNHCVAAHLRPCSHSGFGRLRNNDDGSILQLEYGYQLECRFCKKFEVNSPHNPKRTAAQMKEDAARRRALELLLAELFGGSPSLLYRQATGGGELADDVFNRFGGACFKCGIALASARDMHLDHTRPLALLWPLDAGATALCPTHNSEKRDRPPAEYYDEGELVRLAAITGIPFADLVDPRPNGEAIRRLLDRIEWFFDSFLQQPDLQEARDGKRPADLLVKALRKVLSAAEVEFDIQAAYENWQAGRSPL